MLDSQPDIVSSRIWAKYLSDKSFKPIYIFEQFMLFKIKQNHFERYLSKSLSNDHLKIINIF